MRDRDLYSIEEARELLGGISRNTIYSALRTGELSSVVIGCPRFISAAAIQEFIQAAKTCVSPARAAVRDRRPRNRLVPAPIPARASARAAERGHFAILPSLPSPPSTQKR
jgi:excisionase family DNA binding protein